MLSGCALAVRSPSVAELKYNPGRYQDKTVAIDGVVTSSWGVPLMPFRLYKVDDGTGRDDGAVAGRPGPDQGRARAREGTRQRRRDVRRHVDRPAPRSSATSTSSA